MKKKKLKARIDAHLAQDCIQALPIALTQPRGLGHTETMLRHAEETGAIVVFAIESQTVPYRNRFPGVRFETLSKIKTQRGQGYECDRPVLIDNSVWGVVARSASGSRDLLREASQKLKAKK